MKILMLVTRNQLLSQKIISWHKKSSLVTRNQFLPQEIHSYHKKSILVKRNQFLWSHILWLNYFINTQQRVKPTKKFAWMLTFRGNLVPREFAALVWCEHFEERNNKIHNWILLLGYGYLNHKIDPT